jgi:hypothetical protein
MTIDASIASNATHVIRNATGSVRSAADWATVQALVGQIDEAVDRGDEARVERLTAKLESLDTQRPAKRGRGAATFAIVVVVLVAAMLGIVTALSDDDSVNSAEPDETGGRPSAVEDHFDYSYDVDASPGQAEPGNDSNEGETGSGGGSDDEGDSGSNGGSNGGPLVGIGIAAAIGLVLLAFVVRLLFGKRQRPTDDAEGHARPSSARSLPRLPAPDEIIELANHTIHHLGLRAP